ncbi:MAG: SxtJ family membrane protein [Fidelibacterota bacterium]
MDLTIPELDKKGLRKFGLTTGLIVLVLFELFFPWILDRPLPRWPLFAAGSLWILALGLPRALNPIYKGWLVFGQVLGWINTRIILGILFFGIFMPSGFIMRLLGKDPLARKLESSLASYRVKTVSQSNERMRRPF